MHQAEGTGIYLEGTSDRTGYSVSTLALMRSLSGHEREFLSFMLTQPLKGSAEFLAQLPLTSAELRDTCGCPSLTLSVDRTRAAPAPIGPKVHFEARGKLADRQPVDVIVHHHAGYLEVLEFIAYTSPEHSEFAIPETKRFELFGWDEDDPATFSFRSKLG